MKFLPMENGGRMAYRDEGTGPALVLLHGWGMSSAVFSGVVERLAQRYRVLVPDLPGHGVSDGGGVFGFDELATVLRRWFEDLELGPSTVLGWSMGGQVLLTLYPCLRDRIDRLILVATTPAFAASGDWPHGLPPARIRAMGRNFRRDPRRTLDDFFALQFAGDGLPQERIDALVASFRREIPLPQQDVALRGLDELLASDQRGALAGIDCPVLVVHGKQDAVVPAAAGRYLSGEIPRARLVLLPDTGHAPFLSRPEETLELWSAFAK